jgi:Tol biopolymer transport system component
VQLIVSAGFPLLLFDAPSGLMNVSGTGGQAALLAGTHAGDSEPSWSADGTHIAYVSGSDIVLAVPGKPGSVILHRAGAKFRDPTFAPAGQVMAVVRRTGNDGDLCVAAVAATTKASCIAEPGTDVGRSVSWSPDGKQILVAGHPSGDANRFGLVLYRSAVPFSAKAADWGRGTVVTDATRAGVGALAGAFSPDGKQLAVAANTGGGGFQLFVTTPDDFKLSKAQPYAVAACLIAWRPDSLEIALVANPGCRDGVEGQIARFAPAHPDRVVPLVASGAHPAWQPLHATG